MQNNTTLKLVGAPTSVRALAADTLRQAIITGQLAPGERIVEHSLAKQLGVGRPSLREALILLAAEKLVTITPNRGPTVAIISRADAERIQDVITLLVVQAAGRSAVSSDESHVERMRKAVKEFGRASSSRDLPGVTRAGVGFYVAMLQGSGNPIILELLGNLSARINVLRYRSMARRGRAAQVLSEIKAILEAIERRDPEKARAAAAEHLRNATAATLQALAEEFEANGRS